MGPPLGCGDECAARVFSGRCLGDLVARQLGVSAEPEASGAAPFRGTEVSATPTPFCANSF